jgi:hypothetical protein
MTVFFQPLYRQALSFGAKSSQPDDPLTERIKRREIIPFRSLEEMARILTRANELTYRAAATHYQAADPEGFIGQVHVFAKRAQHIRGRLYDEITHLLIRRDGENGEEKA